MAALNAGRTARGVLSTTCFAPRRPRTRGIACAVTKTALCVHGAGGGGWEFDLWRDPFTDKNWNCVAPDLQPVADGGLAATTLNDYIQQVRDWYDEHAPQVLIGASMGGALAVLAACQLETPPPLVLVNSVIPRPWARCGRKEGPVPDVLRWKGSSLASTERALPDSTVEVQRWACSQWRDEAGAVMRALQPTTSSAAGTMRSSRHPTWDALPSARSPVLFIIGEDDRDCPPDAQLAWAEAWEAEARLYPSMSHVGPLLGTAAPAVASHVLDWLEAPSTLR